MLTAAAGDWHAMSATNCADKVTDSAVTPSKRILKMSIVPISICVCKIKDILFHGKLN